MITVKTPIYQAQQIREFERLASERFGIGTQAMMQRAGKAAFDFLLRKWPQAQKVAVFCGAGNNGGDGYVVARLVHERGIKVTIWQVGNHDNLTADAKTAYSLCQQLGITIVPFSEGADLQHPDVIVDAICGTGLRDHLRLNVVLAVEKIKRAQVPILSLDVPTGIDADTGEVLGTAIFATVTITFIGLKLGLLTGNGVAYTGELVANDLQLPSELFSYIDPIAEKIQIGCYARYLKPRLRNWHKGLSGHVLIVGGACGYSGAVHMAALAALRVGAGLVSVATRPEHAFVLNNGCPEIMCHAVETASDLEGLVNKATVIVLGPGLGQSPWAKSLWDYIYQSSVPLVVDADGLNLLAANPKRRNDWILTPHPGEAARLLKTESQQIQQDRLRAIKEIEQQYGGVCILKGAGSLILSAGDLPALCDKGNPGMASAGMGDVLSGVLGGWVAQGVPLYDAAKLGVCLHAQAGDLAAKEGERGLIATDLMPYLRRLSN